MKGKKRLNPDTGKPFKRGDISDKGYFKQFDTNNIDKEGYFYLRWFSSKESYEKAKSRDIEKENIRKRKAKELGNKRLNPTTGKPFKRGERDKDGRYFIMYGAKADKDGYFYEQWGDYEEYKKRMIQNNLTHIRARARAKNILCNIDIDYMMSIYPKDDRCPVLGFKFELGLDNPPPTHSIERIIPKKGYVKGNVIVISKRANLIKSDASSDELEKVATFFKNLEDKD